MLGQLLHVRFTALNGREQSSKWEYRAQKDPRVDPIGINNLIPKRPWQMQT